MSYDVHEFSQHVCPRCGTARPGAVVYETPERGLGNHYLYVDCPDCGETVSGIRGFRNGLAIDTVLLDSDDSIAQAVIAKVHRVKAGEPEPGTEDKDKGDIPDLPENFQF